MLDICLVQDTSARSKTASALGLACVTIGIHNLFLGNLCAVVCFGWEGDEVSLGSAGRLREHLQLDSDFFQAW
jgi:hypothetical protein